MVETTVHCGLSFLRGKKKLVGVEGALWSPLLVCKATVQSVPHFPQTDTRHWMPALRGIPQHLSMLTPHRCFNCPWILTDILQCSIQRRSLAACYKYWPNHGLIKSLWKNITERWRFLSCASPNSQLPGCVISPCHPWTNTELTLSLLPWCHSPWCWSVLWKHSSNFENRHLQWRNLQGRNSRCDSMPGRTWKRWRLVWWEVSPAKARAKW